MQRVQTKGLGHEEWGGDSQRGRCPFGHGNLVCQSVEREVDREMEACRCAGIYCLSTAVHHVAQGPCPRIGGLHATWHPRPQESRISAVHN